MQAVLVINVGINMADIHIGVCIGILNVFTNPSIEPARQSSLASNRQPEGLYTFKGC